MCKLRDVLNSCNIIISCSSLYLDMGNTEGVLFRTSFCPLNPVCDSYPIAGTEVSFSAIYRLMIGFTLPKCKEKKDDSSFCNWVYSVQLTVTLSGSAVSHTWCIYNLIIKRKFQKSSKNIYMCQAGSGEEMLFCRVVTFSHLMPQREVGGCPIPGSVPGLVGQSICSKAWGSLV